MTRSTGAGPPPSQPETPRATRGRASGRATCRGGTSSAGGPGGSGSTAAPSAANRRSVSRGACCSSVPFLLVERPLGRVVVLLLYVQRDLADLVELLEVPGLPRGEEGDEREAREDEEGVHHPVGHDPPRLFRLR